jgi:hypothetical protein
MLRWVATIGVALGAVGTGCGSTNGVQGGDAGGHDGTVPQPEAGDASGPDRTSPPREGGTDSGIDAGSSVLQYHLNPSRDGHYVDPVMTPAYASTLALDPDFGAGEGASILGPLWGQALYVESGINKKGTFYVADDNNDVYAIDATSGQTVKSRTPLAMAAGMAGSGCGNVTPVGVTSAPYIDLASRTMYLAAAVGTASTITTFEIHALSIDDLSEAPGWPLDISTLASASGVKFNPPPQGQRGGLALINGRLYVAWGGEASDCGAYYGWLVSVPLDNPKGATGYTTAAYGGGMWAVGGVASDGNDIFAVSGNAKGGSGSTWQDYQSEAVVRFHDGTAFDATNTMDFFAPSNWQFLDEGDVDLVGTGPLVLDVPGATPSALVVAMGKSGVMYVLDRSNLGGLGTGNGTIGEGLVSSKIGIGALRGAAAAYTTSKGTFIVVHSDEGGSYCPGATGLDLIAVQITPTNPPQINTVWCAKSGGNGSPIVTTTDSAGSNPIVWIVGTEGSNQLTGWDGETGANIFDGGGITMDTVIHWTTPIDVNGRIIVGANDKIYAFKGK